MTLAELQYARNAEIKRLLWSSKQVRELVQALRYGEVHLMIRDGKIDTVKTNDSIKSQDYPEVAA